MIMPKIREPCFLSILKMSGKQDFMDRIRLSPANIPRQSASAAMSANYKESRNNRNLFDIKFY